MTLKQKNNRMPRRHGWLNDPNKAPEISISTPLPQ
jgi:hypothetical protein